MVPSIDPGQMLVAPRGVGACAYALPMRVVPMCWLEIADRLGIPPLDVRLRHPKGRVIEAMRGYRWASISAMAAHDSPPAWCRFRAKDREIIPEPRRCGSTSQRCCDSHRRQCRGGPGRWASRSYTAPAISERELDRLPLSDAANCRGGVSKVTRVTYANPCRDAIEVGTGAEAAQANSRLRVARAHLRFASVARFSWRRRPETQSYRSQRARRQRFRGTASAELFEIHVSVPDWPKGRLPHRNISRWCTPKHREFVAQEYRADACEPWPLRLYQANRACGWGNSLCINRFWDYFGKSLEDLKDWRSTDSIHPDDLLACRLGVGGLSANRASVRI